MGKYSEAIRKKYSLLKRKTDDKYDPLFKEWFKLDKDDNCDSHLYESNIHPFIRFIHDRQIQPANWISVEDDEGDEEEELVVFAEEVVAFEGVSVDDETVVVVEVVGASDVVVVGSKFV